jgi:putative FmdB family regulatory protein
VPLYEYKCEKCGHRFEKIESVTAADTKKCPKCGRKALRMASAPAIQFKGTGWYVTDYGGKKAGSTARPDSPESSSSASSSEKTSKKASPSKETPAKSKKD